MELLIAQWVSKECAEALKSYRKEWQASMIKLVEAERAKFKDLVEELGTSLTPPLNPQIRQLNGARERDDADE
jgi:hypothetical protein